MKMQRVFLALATGFLLFHRAHVQAAEEQWFRGQMHMHSYWSDGNAFPEQAADLYKQSGYHFVALTEHNVLATSTSAWREVAASTVAGSKIARSRFDDYVAAFNNEVDRRVVGAVTNVRLKTVAEVKTRLDEAGRFLVMPGMEISQTVSALESHPASVQLHMNAMNLPVVLPYTVPSGATTSQLIGRNAALAAAAEGEAQRYTLAVNHPFWVYCDIVPQNLIDRPEVRFFEVCNGGSSYAPADGAESYTCEKFWDSVNAFRRLRKKPLLFGLGTDDAHHYQPPAMNGPDGFGSAWVEVRSASLSPEGITAAMRAGDFYASCGVQLEEVAFTKADMTLRVKVKAQEGATYRIIFISTKRDFDQTVRYVAWPASGNRPARTVPVYSDGVGQIIKTVEGTEAACRMADDDLYVRARIESSLLSKFTRNFYPVCQTAWTQPYSADEADDLTPASEASSGESVPLITQNRDSRTSVPGAPLDLVGLVAAFSDVARVLTVRIEGSLLSVL